MQSTTKAYKLRKGVSEEILILREYIKHSDLESPLAELGKIRTSQINGFDRCVDKHKKSPGNWGKQPALMGLYGMD